VSAERDAVQAPRLEGHRHDSLHQPFRKLDHRSNVELADWRDVVSHLRAFVIDRNEWPARAYQQADLVVELVTEWQELGKSPESNLCAPTGCLASIR
jgi:hypothetical protein